MSPKKLLAVLGATGTQGSSVMNHVLSNPSLSSQFSLRALTRSLSSSRSKIPPKVEVAEADVTSPSSLQAALEGVHTLFVMTPPAFGPDVTDPVETEVQWVKTIADAAVAKGVSYIIYSTLPDVTAISGGKLTKVTPFDAKARAEVYIRELRKKGVKSAFICLGWFMHTYFPPEKEPGTDTWVLQRNTSPQTKMPMLDATADTGKFVGAILEEPEKFGGKTIYAAEGVYTLEEAAEIMSKVTGKKIVYRQVSDEELVERVLKGFPEQISGVFVEGFKYGEEFGYFGPGTEEKVEWAVKNAVNGEGELTGLEEFFRKNPPALEEGAEGRGNAGLPGN